MGTLNVANLNHTGNTFTTNANLNFGGSWVDAPTGTTVQTVTNIVKDQTLGANRYVYITSTSYQYSGASVSITPRISGSTILITAQGRLGSSYPNYINHNWQIMDNNGDNLPDYESSFPLYFYQRYQTGDGSGFMFQQGIHTNVTSSQTYKLYGLQSFGNGILLVEPVIMIAQEISV